MLKRIAVLGGDNRMIYLLKTLRKNGFKAEDLISSGDVNTIKICDAAVLPVPVSREGKTLFAPLREDKITLSDIAALCGEKPVFGGCFKINLKLFSNPYDYGEREEFAVKNAVATAEGAVALAIENTDTTLFNSPCLVTGYGRVAKCLADRLQKLGAFVTVAARKQRDLAWIYSNGFCPLDFCHLKDEIGKNLVIFNTVPSQVINRPELEKLSKEAVIIDLASAPGGVDTDAARDLGIKLITALSLPGKIAPKTSGEIIYDCIARIISEEKL